MYSKNNSFMLFGVKTFELFVLDKRTNIAQYVQDLTDDVISNYEKILREKSDEIALKFVVKVPTISFEKDSIKIDPYVKNVNAVDRFRRRNLTIPRAFVRYSLPIAGEIELLKVCPYSFLPQNIPVVIAEGKYLEFELDTQYADTNFPDDKAREIKAIVLSISDFISNTLKDLDKAVQKYNSEIPEYTFSLLNNRLVKIKQHLLSKQNLNPF